MAIPSFPSRPVVRGALCALGASACLAATTVQAAWGAREQMQPPPVAASGATLALRHSAEPSAMGRMRIADSDLQVVGYNKVGAVASMFGALGVLVSAAANESKAKDGIPGVVELPKVDLVGDVRSELAGPLAAARATAQLALPDAPGQGLVLDVTPLAILHMDSDDQADAWVRLDVSLHDAGGHVVWSTRYTAGSGQAHPLVGAGAWAADGGAAFTADLRASLEQALRVMLDDIARHPARDAATTRSFKTRTPWQPRRWPVEGPVIFEDDHWLALLNDMSDASGMGGVMILDRRTLGLASAPATVVPPTPVGASAAPAVEALSPAEATHRLAVLRNLRARDVVTAEEFDRLRARLVAAHAVDEPTAATP
jgi:hypothetical protein